MGGVVEKIQAAISAAETAADLTERLQDYESARRTLLFVKHLSDPPYSDVAAEDALADLEANGINADGIALSAVETIATQLSRGLPSDEATQLRGHAYETIDTMESATFKAQAYIALARSVSDDPSAVVGYLQRGLSAARQANAEGHDQLLSDLAEIAFKLPQAQGDPLVTLAIEQMTRVQNRAEARRSYAVTLLAGSRYADAGANGLARASVRLLESDLPSAVLTALAISFDDARPRREALSAVLDYALAHDDENLFLVLATAFPGEEEQGNVIAKIVDDQVGAGRLLNALPFLDMIPASGTQVRERLKVAAALKAAQYDLMAQQVYDQGIVGLDNVSVDERATSLGEAIRASLALQRFDDTMTYFNSLASFEDLNDLLGEAVVDLAGAGRFGDAETVLSVITDTAAMENAKATLAAAQLATGADPGPVLDALTSPESRLILLNAIARSRAESGDVDGVTTATAQIDVSDRRADALLDAADVFLAKDNTAGALALINRVFGDQTAISTAGKEPILARLAGALAKAGEATRANEVLANVTSESARAIALSAIAVALTEQGQPGDAYTLLTTMPAVPDHDVLAARVLVALGKDSAWLRRVTAAVSEFDNEMLRVRTFREIAQEQLAVHDIYGWGTGTGESYDRLMLARPVSAIAVAATPIPIFSTTTEQLATIQQRPSALTSYSFPDLTFGVEDIRRQLPLPQPGKVSVTLAHLSPYNEKFLEDLAGGENGISTASAAQLELYPKIVVIESGVYTLGMLAQELAGEDDLVIRDGDSITLRAPVLISAGATLILSGQEAGTYRLSATAGSFIAAAGTLYVVDTHVMSWDEATKSSRHSTVDTAGVFRPYIIGWSGSNLMVGGSFLDSLGYAAPKSFGLGFSAGPTSVTDSRSDLPAPRGHVVDNSFHNFEYGFYSYEAQDVFLVGNEYTDNIIYAVDPHDRSKRLVIALNTAYGTHKKHGIITSREVDNSWIVGNIAFDNHGSGFMLDRDSTDTLLYANVAFDNQGDGLTLFESSCNLIAGNEFFDNDRAGIKVRNSWDVAIFNNQIVGNGQSAIEGYTSRIEDTSPGRNFVEDPYIALTTFAAGDNVISANRDGIKVRGVAGFSLFGQDFSGQPSPLLGGDAKAFEGHLLRFNDRSGVLVRSTSCLVPRPPNYCGFRQSGIFAGLALELAYGAPRQDCAVALQAAADQAP